MACDLFAKKLVGKAKRNAKWTDRTAHGRQGINGGSYVEGEKYIIYLSYGVDYGEILEKGQKPHDITPKNGKALYWKGAAHPMKKVHHPGTEGFHTLEKTLEDNREVIVNTLKDYWNS